MDFIKVLHIHSDLKFIYNADILEGPGFINTNLVITNQRQENLEFKDMVDYIYSKEDLSDVVKRCLDYDIVLLHDLDDIKIKITNALPKSLKVAWRFFGYELYSKKPEVFLSKKSLKYTNFGSYLPVKVKLVLKRLKKFVKRMVYGNDDFESALKRIDFFLCLCKQEYHILQTHWLHLPEFIKLPHFKIKDSDSPFLVKITKTKDDKPKVVLGNNRSNYNNHLDVISIIKQSKNKDNITFKLLFNYGTINSYSKQVLKEARTEKSIEIIDSYLQKDEFLYFYDGIDAFVMNGYRQMAVGNIHLALSKGVKVYLNIKNAYFDFLVSEKFKVFTIEDFVNDLDKGTFVLNDENRDYNIKLYKEFSRKYSDSHFQERLRNAFELTR